MADSKYYKDLYKKYKKQVESYRDDIKDLQKALDKLTGTMNDEIRNVNKEIEALKDDLSDSVRHNSKFNTSVNQIVDKQKGTDVDSYLKVVIQDLQDEIYQLNKKKNTAQYNWDYYEAKYKEKKEEERKEFWDKVF